MKTDVYDYIEQTLSGYGGFACESDQQGGVSQPPMFCCRGGELTRLPRDFSTFSADYLELLSARESRRSYAAQPFTLAEFAFLLYSAVGVKKVLPTSTKRSAPSAGARHPLELYAAAANVEGLSKGIYHYLPDMHAVELVRASEKIEDEIAFATMGQTFAATGGALLIFTAVPYRCAWRYGEKAGKYALLDAGHACQNVYLSCEAAGLGCCAIAAYDQEYADKMLGLAPLCGSENDEMTVYMIAAGHRKA